MKCRVTKVMAKELQKKFPAYTITFETMDERAYSLYVGDSLRNNNDYDYETSKFKVIRVEYPSDYYAMPRYLSTNDLVRIFNRAADKTFDSFIKVFKREIEI